MDGTVLIADDDKTIRTVLSQALKRAGCKVNATSSLTTLTRWIKEGIGNAVILDVIMPDGNGLELLPEIKKIRPELPVIIISAQNTLTTAIKVEHGKAFDYLAKPFDLSDLMKRVSQSLKNEEKFAKNNLPQLNEKLPLIGSSSLMVALYRKVAKLINMDEPILVTGESGSGKTLISETIHNYSDRRNLPLLKISATDFSDYDKCIDRIKIAKGGSVIIEEVNSFSNSQQNCLTRVIDYSFRDTPRFIVTNKTPAVVEKPFSIIEPSLLFRLNKFSIEIPALRFRLSDINELLESYLMNTDISNENLFFDDESIDLLKNFHWPGNVRQFQNVLSSLIFVDPESVITPSKVKKILDNQPKFEEEKFVGERLSKVVEFHIKKYFDGHGNLLPPKGVYQRILKELEAPIIEISLDACKGNQIKCADLLGLNRNTLRKKIKNININVAKYKKLM